jgi:methylated-DNA-[protein]-cysteine S-methyltransferase
MTSKYDAVVCAETFNIGVRCDSNHVLSVEYLPRGPAIAAAGPVAKEAERQIQKYLADPSTVFDLPLAAAGTTYQKRVWDVLTSIPSGQTLRYGDVARTLTSGPRAVGNACGANPYPLVVPCHRVLPAQGGIGGFARKRDGFLPTVKAWLLRHEAAEPATVEQQVTSLGTKKRRKLNNNV